MPSRNPFMFSNIRYMCSHGSYIFNPDLYMYSLLRFTLIKRLFITDLSKFMLRRNQCITAASMKASMGIIKSMAGRTTIITIRVIRIKAIKA